MKTLLLFIFITINANASGPFTYQVSESVPFDNSTNAFISDNAQDAIEEARDTAQGKARATIASVHNGIVPNGFWIGYSDLVNSFDSPFVLAWNATLKEVTFSNKRTSVDGRIKFFKNGTTNADLVHNELLSNINKTTSFSPNIIFLQGDLLRLKWVDNGQNPKDMGIMMFFILN